MKARATIICSRGGQILLVARPQSRWSLPGGTIKKSESPRNAARRELEEETTIAGTQLTYLFQFGGLSKRHLVFFVDLPLNKSARPSNEICECKWLIPSEISTVNTSIPTREIVELFLTRDARDKVPSTLCDNRDGPLVIEVVDPALPVD